MDFQIRSLKIFDIGFIILLYMRKIGGCERSEAFYTSSLTAPDFPFYLFSQKKASGIKSLFSIIRL